MLVMRRYSWRRCLFCSFAWTSSTLRVIPRLFSACQIWLGVKTLWSILHKYPIISLMYIVGSTFSLDKSTSFFPCRVPSGAVVMTKVINFWKPIVYMIQYAFYHMIQYAREDQWFSKSFDENSRRYRRLPENWFHCDLYDPCNEESISEQALLQSWCNKLNCWKIMHAPCTW